MLNVMRRDDTDNYEGIFVNDIPLIDTRAPVEFKKGAFGNAVNIPLMDDAERHQVGIRYKEAGQEAAIQLGRELVDETTQQLRTEAWIRFAQVNPTGYLYCFRGGLRSRITQGWMADAGVHYPYVKGGYKAMRRFLIDRFEADIKSATLVLISGRTGAGKTLLLNQIKRSIDLEGLANHRGSSFGAMGIPQPTPINFENRTAVALLKHRRKDQHKPIFIEGEGRQVGSLSLPKSLWEAMQRSPTVILESEMERRIDIGVQDYVLDLLERIKTNTSTQNRFELFAERHRMSLYKIRKRLGEQQYREALLLLEEALTAHRDLQDTAGYRPFIRLLLEKYYDPMYDYQLSNRTSKILFRGDHDELVRWMQNQGVEIIT